MGACDNKKTHMYQFLCTMHSEEKVNKLMKSWITYSTSHDGAVLIYVETVAHVLYTCIGILNWQGTICNMYPVPLCIQYVYSSRLVW